jgi:hypothetical protein
VTVWGHTGETPGYASGMLATRDLARTLVFAFTPVGAAQTGGTRTLITADWPFLT